MGSSGAGPPQPLLAGDRGAVAAGLGPGRWRGSGVTFWPLEALGVRAKSCELCRKSEEGTAGTSAASAAVCGVWKDGSGKRLGRRRCVWAETGSGESGGDLRRLSGFCGSGGCCRYGQRWHARKVSHQKATEA